MMGKSLADKVLAFTGENGLFSAPCHILLGLSGGADSMALLHALTHWPAPGVQVSAVHIHHGLRGDAADRDEAFVRDYCADNCIPLTVVHVDVAAVAHDEHLTLEEAGRRVRYEQFEAIRSAIGADYIATAHTSSDQTETVLMNLLRGCGIDGLAGIPAKRGNICRPLLCCSRQEIEEYCALYHIAFVTDDTNADIKYTRNDVRHRVLPLLRQINPSVDEAILRLRRHASDDADYLNHQAAGALEAAQCEDGYLTKIIAAQPAVIRHRAIRLLLRSVALSAIEESHIIAADDAVLRGNGAVSLPDGHVFCVEQGVASVREVSTAHVPSPVIIDSVPCTVSFGAFNCAVSEYYQDDANVHKLLLQSVIDCDKIAGKLCLRCRCTGDYLHPCGRGIGKSLKKLMNEWRIPAHLRDSYPLLCDESGVLLVPGYTCDERVKTTDNTKHFLVCEVHKVQG